MNTELFSVQDMVAGAYMEPFCAPSVNYAIRGFGEACGQEGHSFNKFPADYALYHIGTFTGESGQLEGLEPRRIAVASAFIRVDGGVDIDD